MVVDIQFMKVIGFLFDVWAILSIVNNQIPSESIQKPYCYNYFYLNSHLAQVEHWCHIRDAGSNPVMGTYGYGRGMDCENDIGVNNCVLTLGVWK